MTPLFTLLLLATQDVQVSKIQDLMAPAAEVANSGTRYLQASTAADVGLTGLALLAFLREGNTTTEGQYEEVVAAGIKWLREQQGLDSGLFGEKLGHTHMYSHAIASLAMCEAFKLSKDPTLKGATQKAIHYISKARNPYGAWRYESPPNGDQDTSVTGWMIFVLKSAEEAGLTIDKEAYTGAMNWIDEVTDTATGRVGYDSFGSMSSRVTGVNDNFPPEKGEAMTSVGLLCRFFLGQDPKENPIMVKQADLLLKALPEWDPDGFSNDMYYWYWGTQAMSKIGGKQGKRWRTAMKKAVLDSQRKDGDFKGSWDPVGPWGYAGGRAYSTALMTLIAEMYSQYPEVDAALSEGLAWLAKHQDLEGKWAAPEQAKGGTIVGPLVEELDALAEALKPPQTNPGRWLLPINSATVTITSTNYLSVMQEIDSLHNVMLIDGVALYGPHSRSSDITRIRKAAELYGSITDYSHDARVNARRVIGGGWVSPAHRLKAAREAQRDWARAISKIRELHRL